MTWFNRQWLRVVPTPLSVVTGTGGHALTRYFPDAGPGISHPWAALAARQRAGGLWYRWVMKLVLIYIPHVSDILRFLSRSV